jgi:SAM-dependent methyltransferase
VLEIGPGTGQLTRRLAALGCDIVAVELGANLARVARRRLAGFPRVRIEVASFDDWPIPAEPFDAVVAATAFHWLDPERRVQKVAAALRPGGAVATLDATHVAGGTIAFFEQVQRCYERWDPATPPDLHLAPAGAVQSAIWELRQNSAFRGAVSRRLEWEAEYTTEQYIDLLSTYSGHRALPDAARTGLLRCIADLVNTGFGGRIRKAYLTELNVAYRV